MKRLKKILLPLAVLSVVMILAMVFSLISLARQDDYSRPGTTNKITLDSAEILEKLGIELSDEEAEYLSLYGEYSIAYGAHIPTSGIRPVYDSDSQILRVFAENYVYRAENGAQITWVPKKAILDGNSVDLVFDGDRSYVCEFSSVSEEREPSLKILYKTEISIAAEILNSLLNKTYDDAEEWAKYRDYLRENEEYEKNMLLYQGYLAKKRVYDEQLDAYIIYLDELKDYEACEAEYEEYILELDKYNSDYDKYMQFLKDQEKYNQNLEAYNKYVENLETVKKQLDIIEGTKRATTSRYRSVYSAIHGNLVKLVLENKDLVANDFVGANGDAIDYSGEATEALKTMYAEYYACGDEIEKYTYYTVNYENFRDNFIKLFVSLDKLYQNAKIRVAIKDQGYKDKFEIFLAQLYYVTNAISDTPVLNFDKDSHYDANYKINRRSPLEVLEGEEYMPDLDCAKPLAKGYPTPCEKPEITEVIEPVPPLPIAKPSAPKVVENPGDAPSEVLKPIAPAYAKPPAELATNGELPEAIIELLALYDSGALVRYPEFAVDSVLELELEVGKQVFGATAVEVIFCNSDGNVLHKTVVDKGSYAEYVGIIPLKADTAEFTYSFIGWKDENGRIADVTAIDADSEIVLYPAFSETKRVYDVVWELEDEVVITQCEYGKIPTIGYTPKKADSDRYMYRFSGWNKRVVPVTGDPTRDRYSVTFKHQYLVPLRDEIFDSDIGGATVTVNGDEWVIDCSSSSASLTIDLSNILPRVASNGKLTIQTAQYTARFSYSDVVSMYDRGVAKFSVMPTRGQREYSFKATFLDLNGKELRGGIGVTLDFKSFTAIDAQKSKIFYETAKGNVYTTGKVGEKSLSVYAIGGLTYHVAPEYNVEVLASGPVNINLDKNSGAVGTVVKFEYTSKPGVEISSFYFIDSMGMRSEIDGDSFVIPSGGGFIGVKYDYIEYIVNFISSGKVVGTRTYKYGEVPEMMAPPVKTADGKYTYTFEKWVNSATRESEPVPVTNNVNYEAFYKRNPIPPKPPKDGLQISDSILRKLVLAASVASLAVFAILPCMVIVLVKVLIIVRRKARIRVKKQKNNVTRVEDSK